MIFTDFPAGSLLISVVLAGVGVYGLSVLLPVASHSTVPIPLIAIGLLLASFAILAAVGIVLRAEYSKVTWDGGERIIHVERFGILIPREVQRVPLDEVVDVVVSKKRPRRGAIGYGVSLLTRSKGEVVISSVWASSQAHRFDAVERLRAWLADEGVSLPVAEQAPDGRDRNRG